LLYSTGTGSALAAHGGHGLPAEQLCILDSVGAAWALYGGKKPWGLVIR